MLLSLSAIFLRKAYQLAVSEQEQLLQEQSEPMTDNLDNIWELV
jgi:hypothetical protein